MGVPPRLTTPRASENQGRFIVCSRQALPLSPFGLNRTSNRVLTAHHALRELRMEPEPQSTADTTGMDRCPAPERRWALRGSAAPCLQPLHWIEPRTSTCSLITPGGRRSANRRRRAHPRPVAWNRRVSASSTSEPPQPRVSPPCCSTHQRITLPAGPTAPTETPALGPPATYRPRRWRRALRGCR